MSTHCLIGIKYGSTIDAIYCHYDGFLNGVGRMLVNYYNSEDLAAELIELGGISSLGEIIGQQIKPDDYQMQMVKKRSDQSDEPLQTLAYHRDRGDALVIDVFTSEEDYVLRGLAGTISNIFLFDEKWKYYDRDDMEWKDINVN